MKDPDRTLVVTVEEAAIALGISRGLAYQLARSGEIPAIRLGRRLVVPRARLEQMVNQAAGKPQQAT